MCLPGCVKYNAFLNSPTPSRSMGRYLVGIVHTRRYVYVCTHPATDPPCNVAVKLKIIWAEMSCMHGLSPSNVENNERAISGDEGRKE